MKKIIFAVFSVLILILAGLSVYFSSGAQKITLKCKIKGSYVSYGREAWQTVDGDFDEKEEYIFIDSKNKTINNQNWEKIEYFDKVIIDKNIIEFSGKNKVDDDEKDFNYIINRKTGEYKGIIEIKNNKLGLTSYHDYKGTCEKVKLEQKF